MVEIAKDDVEVDGFSSEDASPFCAWESLGCCHRTLYVSFCKGDVSLENLEDLSRLLSVFIDFTILCICLDCVPW